MAFCVDERKLQLTELQSFLSCCSTKIANISDKLGWSKNIGKAQELVHCPLKEEHRVPEATLSDHLARCRWKQEGYTEDDLPLSEPAAGSSGTDTRSIFMGVSYADLGSLHEGDIILSSSGRNAVLSQIYKWDDGIVPYVFHHSYESSEKEKVLSAMRQLEADVPCIRFVPWGTEAEYVEIGKRKELGCAAMVGCQRGHAHIVNYRAPECFQSAGIIQHELLHVLGLLHEQARPDRDEYVDIVWDNIHKDYWNDFKKASKDEFTTFDIPYDYKSIMHYPRNAFSKNGNDTIVAKTNPKLDLGQRDHPTENDLEKVRRMYNCSNVLPTVEIK